MKTTRGVWMTLTLLTAFLSISACTPATEFCAVVQSKIQLPRQAAEIVVEQAREEAVQISAQNVFWQDNC